MINLDNKENIRDLKNGLEITKKFDPVLYDLKKLKNIPGLIEEEVLEFYPELVKKNEKGDIIGINYIQIISILISAIKEMDSEMNLMRKNIKQLQNKSLTTADSDLSFLNIFKK